MAKAILLDIEGTTTPIDFVHKTLFPYAREKMLEFVRREWNSIEAERNQLALEAAKETTYTEPFEHASPESAANLLLFLIDHDRKSTPLKSLQGKIWQTGYETGELVSGVFDDVRSAMEKWKSEDKVIAIYSSGSVLAQKLLFRYTRRGDLSSFISAYFDTNIGHKREPDSYCKIAQELSLEPGEILFVSDIVEELDAAANAGMITALSVRDGNAAVVNGCSHPSVRSFAELID